MKKWIVIVLVIGILLFLVTRAAYVRMGRSKDEKQWYVKNLDLHFLTTVDSLRVFSRVNGLVYFQVNTEDLDMSTEERVNKKLKFNASLRFILNLPNGKLAFHARVTRLYSTAAQ